MNCFECGKPFEAGANFCSRCGRNFHSKTNRRAKSNTARTVFSGPSAAALDGLKGIKLRRIRKAKVAATIGAGLACVMGGYLLVYERQPALLILPAILFVMLTVMLHYYTNQVSMSEYRSLPDAIGSDGNIRCIYCGNRGIYKHGEYRSSTVWHDCSKCGQTLFTSSKAF